MLIPIEHRVLVRRKRTEAKTAGGIIIPEAMRNTLDMQEKEVEVVRLGEAAFLGHEIFPKAGDMVLLAKYAGSDQRDKTEEHEYRIVNDTDIVAIVKEDEDE